MATAIQTAWSCWDVGVFVVVATSDDPPRVVCHRRRHAQPGIRHGDLFRDVVRTRQRRKSRSEDADAQLPPVGFDSARVSRRHRDTGRSRTRDARTRSGAGPVGACAWTSAGMPRVQRPCRQPVGGNGHRRPHRNCRTSQLWPVSGGFEPLSRDSLRRDHASGGLLSKSPSRGGAHPSWLGRLEISLERNS